MLGIIGGTGLYSIDNVKKIETVEVETPFGKPSGPLSIITDKSNKVVFLARHGGDHKILPSEINYRANIWALKSVGVKAVLSVSAVGSLREELKPGSFVIPMQYIDYTKGIRRATFFGEGLVGHIATAEPVCANLAEIIKQKAEQLDIKITVGPAYICVEGPRLGTRAESKFFRTIGADIVGMTNVPEAFLAREAQLPYASLCIVTDYDSWKEDRTEHVNVSSVFQIYYENISKVQQIIAELIKTADVSEFSSVARGSLNDAVVSDVLNLSKDKQELLRVLKL